MAFDVSGLTTYVKENEKEIISSAVLGAKTIQLINVRPGIKSSEDIITLETTADFQADSGCSYNTSGTTTFSKFNLAVSSIMVSETLCPKDLEAKVLQRALKPGGKYEDVPFSKEIMDRKVALIQKQLEAAVWQGKTTHTFSTNFKHFDGLITKIDAASGLISATQQADITTSTVRGIFEDIYTKVPAKVLNADDLVCVCGMDTFRTLVIKLTTDNLFHYATDGASDKWELMYPGTNMKVIALPGLNADNHASLPAAYQDRIFATRLSNLYFGTDMLNEQEEVDVWYSKDDRNIKSLFTFKAGTAVAFGDEIVSYKNS